MLKAFKKEVIANLGINNNVLGTILSDCQLQIATINKLPEVIGGELLLAFMRANNYRKDAIIEAHPGDVDYFGGCVRIDYKCKDEEKTRETSEFYRLEKLEAAGLITWK